MKISKERLEEIKNYYKDDLEIAEHAGVCLTKDDYLYLIDQAERVEELESEIENWQEGRFLAVSTFVKEIDLKKTSAGA